MFLKLRFTESFSSKLIIFYITSGRGEYGKHTLNSILLFTFCNIITSVKYAFFIFIRKSIIVSLYASGTLVVLTCKSPAKCIYTINTMNCSTSITILIQINDKNLFIKIK